MTRQETIAFFAKRDGFWKERDAVGLARAHADHAVVVSPMFATVTGRAAIELSYRNLFMAFSDWDFNGEDLIIEGDRVAQIFKVAATHAHEFFGVPGTGRRFELHGVLVFRFEGDRIVHEQRYYDFTGLLVQIGVLKAKPGH